MLASKTLRTLSGFLRIDTPGEDAKDNPQPAGSAGISGFLLLPLYMLTAWSGGVYAIAKAIPYLPQMLFEAMGHNWITPLRVLVAVALVGYSIYCLVQFVQKKRAAPKLLVGFFGLLIAISAVVAIFNPLHLFFFTGVLAAVSTVMIAYFLTSSRVKNTFVR